MASPQLAATPRELRERKAWDEDRVWENCNGWMRRFAHVTAGPNTLRGEKTHVEVIDDVARDASVLEVGCGRGDNASNLLTLGPRQVLGIDISREMIAFARSATNDNRLEFRLHSANDPLDGLFDLIVGRSVLHHIDYREFLERAYASNLAPGGRMVFMEPMAHPMTIAFHKLVRSAHTPDERPLGRAFVSWLRRTFPIVELRGINLISFPAGAISSLLFNDADNGLTRAADAVDVCLLAHLPGLATYARQSTIAIGKPS